VAKNRGGQTGVGELRFEKAYNLFSGYGS